MRNQNERQFKMSLPVGPFRCAVHQNGIGCEQTAEQNAVAHQVDPEPEDFRRSCIVVRMFMRVGSRVRQSISCHFSAPL